METLFTRIKSFVIHHKTCFVVLTSAMLVIACLISAFAVFYADFVSVSEVQPEDKNGMLFFGESQGAILLTMSEATYQAELLSEVTGGVSYTVSATVNPQDAKNKLLDWEIEWAPGAALQNAAISDYFSITPVSDGASKATLLCKKSFRGSSAILSATSRASGVKGICMVTFSGKPSTMSVDKSFLSTVDRGGDKVVVKLAKSQTTEHTISLDNIFHDVGAEYKNYSVKVTGIGSFQVGTKNKTTGNWTNLKTMGLDSVKDNYISAKIENGKLVIEAKGCYESYFSMTTINGTLSNLFYVKDNVDNSSLPYYQIRVTENITGVTYSFNVYIDCVVTNVTIVDSAIDF